MTTPLPLPDDPRDPAIDPIVRNLLVTVVNLAREVAQAARKAERPAEAYLHERLAGDIDSVVAEIEAL